MAEVASLGRLKAALAERYRIERELGAGGMATVYLARDVRHDRPVALKVLRPELAAVVGGERFLTEIRVTAALDHPHILTLIDSGETEGFLWYVVPYVRGESLRDRLRREKQLPLEDALAITRQVAGALDHAHSRGVIHRDIKPENILLHEGEAMLADFGIALAAGTAAGTRLTETGLSLGTPEYMSPEQATSDRGLDARSDVYALGAVAYEMLAGEPPHSGPSGQAVIARLLTERPTPLRILRETVPESVDAAVAKALAKAPADRFASAGAFAAALAAPGPTGKRRLRRLAVPASLALATMLLAAVAVLSSAGNDAGSGPAVDSGDPATAIAVLPFQNLSADSADAYFARGLHDELLTQLSKVSALSLRGRTSVMGYAGTTKPIRQIADELRVGALLVGSVQVLSGRLRVNVELIDAATEENLWADSYLRSLDDAFAIQSEVAQQVVAAVGAELEQGERLAIADAPTDNPEAYKLYLQGLGYHRQLDLRAAQQLYEQALRLDPEFVLAYVELSRVHWLMHWWRWDPSPARLEAQRAAASAAVRLAPDLPQARLAMLLGRRDPQAVFAELQLALREFPNDVRLLERLVGVHLALGNWDEAFRAFERAVELDPRNGYTFLVSGGFTYEFARRYADAVWAYERAYALAPDLHEAALRKSLTLFSWQGQLDTLRAFLQRVPRCCAKDRADLLLWERQADSLLALVASVPSRVFSGARWYYLPTSLYAGWAHQLRGDSTAARPAFETALAVIDSAAVVLDDDDYWVHIARGLALAGLGRRDEALREARWLEEYVGYRVSAYERSWVGQHRAMILAQAGEADMALDELEPLLGGPAYLSVHHLRLDPRWDPLRDHPRFRSLLALYGPVPG